MKANIYMYIYIYIYIYGAKVSNTTLGTTNCNVEVNRPREGVSGHAQQNSPR